MRRDDIIRSDAHAGCSARRELFAQGRKRADLDSDRMLVLSLVKDIEIIGEAAYQTSEETRRQLTEISWDDIIGMRHRLVHAYFDINLDILWRTAQDDLPQLSAVLEKIVARYF